MDPVTLYHLAPSHHCERARKILDLKGIPYELEPVAYQDHGDLIRATGQDYAPAIRTADGGIVVWDGIARWAEELVPEPTLFPGEDPARVQGICRVIEDWCIRVVEDATWTWAVPDAPDRFDDPDERWRFVEFQERRFGDLGLVRLKRDHLLADVEGVCRLAEGLLGEDRFLLGDEPSLADPALYGGLHPLFFVDAGLPKGFDDLAGWWERVDGL